MRSDQSDPKIIPFPRQMRVVPIEREMDAAPAEVMRAAVEHRPSPAAYFFLPLLPLRVWDRSEAATSFSFLVLVLLRRILDASDAAFLPVAIE
jgi:hypothetical protein